MSEDIAGDKSQGASVCVVQDPTASMGAGIDKNMLQAHTGLSNGDVLILEKVCSSLRYHADLHCEGCLEEG